MIEINFIDQLGNPGYISIATSDVNTSLALDASSHPVLSFPDTPFFDPIRTSSLEVTVLIPHDFPFHVLKPNLQAQYRIGSERTLQWQGSLDASQLRFPYFHRGELQPLTLTFTDFAPLADRLFSMPSDSPRVISLLDALCLALYPHSLLDQDRFRTHLEAFPAPLSLKDQQSQHCAQFLQSLFVDSSNFADENQTPLDCFQVVSSILRPFCLHIRQTGYAYPIIYSPFEIPQAYSIQARHANSHSDFILDAPVDYAEVTHSTFADKNIFDRQISPDDINPDSKYQLYAIDLDQQNLNYLPAFRLHLGSPITNGLEGIPQFKGHNQNLRFAHISPVSSGTDTVVILAIAKGSANSHSTVPQNQQDLNYNIIPDPFNLSCPRLNPISGGGFSLFQPAFSINCGLIHAQHIASNQHIHISLPLIADARYNPFEDPSANNFKDNQKKLDRNANFAYIPIRITISDPLTGQPSYYYSNHNTALSNSWRDDTYTIGKWRKIDDQSPMPDTVTAWLAYYDADNRTSATGLGCLVTNHQTIGCTTEPLPRQISAWGDNLVLPIPPQSGILTITIGLGIYYHDHRTNQTDIHPLFRFFAYQLPKITLSERYNAEPQYTDNVETVTHPQFKPQLISTSRNTSDTTIILSTLDHDEALLRKPVPANAKGYILNQKAQPLTPDAFSQAPDGITRFVAEQIKKLHITPPPYEQKIINYSTVDNYPLSADSSVSVLSITDADHSFTVISSSEDIITRTTQYNARQTS